MASDTHIYAHGKLLLTAEYVVLDGACALALPTKRGQRLDISPIAKPEIKWRSYSHDNNCWLDHSFNLPLKEKTTMDNPVVQQLLKILQQAQHLNPTFLNTATGFDIKTYLEFPRNWGLGSSSTLIASIAQWANINPYALLEATFGGSGYDIACAFTESGLTYQLQGKNVCVTPVAFDPPFKEALFFIHLNKKQNSRDSIKHYRNTAPAERNTVIHRISEITAAILKCTSLEAFEQYLLQHETLISELINTPRIQNTLFPDYTDGVIKSLGGWGGDFVLATGTKESIHQYFNPKGYTTIIKYSDMIL